MARLGWTDNDIYRVSERAFSLLGQGRYAEAAVVFQGLVEVDQSNSYCWNGLAACHLAQGDADGAVRVLDEFLRHEPDNVHARARRCEALLLQDHYGAALEDLEWLRKSRAVAAVQRLELMFRQASKKFDDNEQLTISPDDN